MKGILGPLSPALRLRNRSPTCSRNRSPRSSCLQAHQQLYKESEGSVLILYSPKLTKEAGSGFRQGGARVTLTVDKPEQVGGGRGCKGVCEGQAAAAGNSRRAVAAGQSG